EVQAADPFLRPQEIERRRADVVDRRLVFSDEAPDVGSRLQTSHDTESLSFSRASVSSERPEPFGPQRGQAPPPTPISQAENGHETAPIFSRSWLQSHAGRSSIATLLGCLHLGRRPAMSLSSDSKASAVLQAAQAGDRQAAADLLPLVYAELHQLARARL